MNSNKRQAFVTAICTMLLFLSVAYVACNKPSSPVAPDRCDNVTCKNGGTCVQGTCSCINGFEDSDCGKRSITRFIGNWDIQETIVGSSNKSHINQKSAYKVAIREEAGSNIRFIISNFMNRGTDIMGDLGLKYNSVTKLYERDLTTNFILRDNQTIKGTYITLISGYGKVDNFGNSLLGTYYIVYPKDAQVVNDTINFVGSYIK